MNNPYKFDQAYSYGLLKYNDDFLKSEVIKTSRNMDELFKDMHQRISLDITNGEADAFVMPNEIAEATGQLPIVMLAQTEMEDGRYRFQHWGYEICLVREGQDDN